MDGGPGSFIPGGGSQGGQAGDRGMISYGNSRGGGRGGGGGGGGNFSSRGRRFEGG